MRAGGAAAPSEVHPRVTRSCLWCLSVHPLGGAWPGPTPCRGVLLGRTRVQARCAVRRRTEAGKEWGLVWGENDSYAK